MARQHTLGKIKDVANRVTRTALTLSGKAVDRAITEVGSRVAARRSTPPESPAPRGPERTVESVPKPASAPLASVPSPADVARVVARHPENRPRPATPAKRKPVRPSAPGAKLPARAGQGILGV